MKLEDFKITPEEAERILLQQGNEVLAVLQMQGWKIIEESLKLSIQKAQIKRRQALDKQSTRETGLYLDGVEDGVLIAKEDVYEIVNAALRARQAKDVRRELEEELK